MYIFNIKDDGVKLDVVITRSMLAIAAIAAFFYNSAENYYLNIISAVVLFMAAIFIHFLIDKLRLTKFILFASAAILFFISTRSIAFSLILLSYGYLIKYFNKKPIIQVSADGITISKLFSNKMYLWDEFANLIFSCSDQNINWLPELNVCFHRYYLKPDLISLTYCTIYTNILRQHFHPIHPD